MLVQRIMEFMRELRKFSSLNQVNTFFLKVLEENFSLLNPNNLLSAEQISVLTDAFVFRLTKLTDTLEDFTRGPNSGINRLGFDLFAELSAETGISLLKLLNLVVKHTYDPMLLKPIDLRNGKSDLLWLILSEDKTHLINLFSWLREVKRGVSSRAVYWDDVILLSSEKIKPVNNRVFATYVALNSPVLRAFSLYELLRIRCKGTNLATDYSFKDATNTTYRNFWDYLERRVMPTWPTLGKLPAHLLAPLIELVDIYYAETQRTSQPGVFRDHVLLWAKKLQTCPANDTNHLYAQPIMVGEKTTYLINVLLDCLEFHHSDLSDHLQGLARFLCKYDASYVIRREEFSALYLELKIQDAFEINELKEDLVTLSLDCSGNLNKRITSLLNVLSNKTLIDTTILEGLERIYMHHKVEYQGKRKHLWTRLAQKLEHLFLKTNYYSLLMPLEIISFAKLNKIKKIHGSVYYSFFGKIYENYSGYLTQHIAPEREQYTEVPRHVLPSLLKLVDVYFYEEITSFRDQLFSWAKDLETCSNDDVHCLFIQPVQVDNSSVYFLDALLTLMYGDQALIKETIMGLACWLCQYDASYIAQAEELQPVYSEAQLGSSFDKYKLLSMLTQLISGSSPKISLRLDKLLELMQHKACIDYETLKLVGKIYKQRWAEIQGQENCYLYRQDGQNKKWIDLAAALSGAKLIPENYYWFLMPSLIDNIDSVKRVLITHYPLSHYLFSGVSFEKLILLDNCVEQYYVDKMEDEVAVEEFRESLFLYNCNLEKRNPLNLEQHNGLLYANIKFRKFFELTQSPDHADEPICLATLDALTALVNGSVFPRGVIYTVDYHREQKLLADKAYFVFCEFYNQLPEDEKLRLNNQLIYFNGTCKSFKKLLFEINSYQCTAKVGQYLLQLIVDYLPKRTFSTSIETDVLVQALGESVRASVGLDQMRANSRNKIPRDAFQFEHRAYALISSLLTHTFDLVLFSGYSISAFNHSNKVIAVAKHLFTVLLLMLEEGDFSKYSDLVYLIVQPALADENILIKIRSEKNRAWLESIADGSFAENPRLLHQLFQDGSAVTSTGRSSRFFQFNSSDARAPAINPQKAAPIPNKDRPDADTKIVMTAGSR